VEKRRKLEENCKQLLRQRLQPVVLGGPDYEVSTAVISILYVLFYTDTKYTLNCFVAIIQPLLDSVKNWMILLEQSFTACMPLLMAANALRLGRG